VLQKKLPCRYSGYIDFTFQKAADKRSDFRAMRFKCKVPGIDQVILEVIQIPLIRLGACSKEYLVFLAPDDQGRWLLFSVPDTAQEKSQTARKSVIELSEYVNAAQFKRLEKENIEKAIQHSGGKTWGPDGAAELQGMKPSTLAYQMKKLGITPEDTNLSQSCLSPMDNQVYFAVKNVEKCHQLID
jgi:hypothetical protein